MQTDILTDPGHTRGDLRMIQMAVRKGWVIPDALLEHLPKVLGKIVLTGKPREQVAAAVALVKMKESNDKQSDSNRVDTQRNRILELLEQRGSGGGHIAIEPIGSGVASEGGD